MELPCLDLPSQTEKCDPLLSTQPVACRNGCFDCSLHEGDTIMKNRFSPFRPAACCVTNKKQLTLCWAALMLAMLPALLFPALLLQSPRSEAAPKAPVAGNTTTTTVTIEEDTTGAQSQSSYDFRGVRVIRAYCAEVDRFITKNRGLRRAFVLGVDESASKWTGWSEATGDRSALDKALAGAIAYQRGGRFVFVECFSRNGPSRLTNVIRYYFRPDGTLAKSQTVVRRFQTSSLDNRVIAIEERFLDKRGGWVGSEEAFRHPKTGKKLQPLIYSGEIRVGFPLFSIHRLRNLPFFNLLQRPKSANLLSP